MAFTNLPPNLQDMFNNLQDQINKLVTGPNQAMYTAESAQAASAQAIQEAAAANAQGVQALAEANIAIAQGTLAIQTANNALQQAQASYAVSSQAIIKSANTITNASNQLTSINGNGISVYAGSSGTGARVILNSAGLVGYNSSNSPTFTLDATNGNVSMTGALFTGGTISGGSLNINGACIIESNGKLTATNAVITGNITATSGTFTGIVYASAGTFTGTITSSNATITGGSLTVGSNFQVNTLGQLTASSANITGTITTSNLSATGGSIGGWTIQGSSYLQYGTTYLWGNSVSSSYAFQDTSRGIYVNDILTSGSGASGYGVATGSLYSSGIVNIGGNLFLSGNVTSDFNLSSSSELRVPYAYSTTVTNAATVWISSTGQLRRSTASSQRYKTDIVNLNDVPELNPQTLYTLPVRAFRYKDGYLPATDDRVNMLIPGFIAEEVDSIYPIAADYIEGAETWNERMIIPGMLALIQEQNERIKILEGK